MSKQDRKNWTQFEHEQEQADVIEAIAEHMRTIGASQWKLVKSKFPELPGVTFWRLVDQAKNGITPQDIREKALQRVRAPAEEPPPMTAAPLPAAKPGTRAALPKLDFLDQFALLMKDALLLRQAGLGKKKEGEGFVEFVKIPKFFADSIALRRNLMESAMGSIREVYALNESKEVWDGILAEITKESPLVAERILRRIAEFHARRGVVLKIELPTVAAAVKAQQEIQAIDAAAP